jgi:hypothetical protein
MQCVAELNFRCRPGSLPLLPFIKIVASEATVAR